MRRGEERRGGVGEEKRRVTKKGQKVKIRVRKRNKTHQIVKNVKTGEEQERRAGEQGKKEQEEQEMARRRRLTSTNIRKTSGKVVFAILAHIALYMVSVIFFSQNTKKAKIQVIFQLTTITDVIY